MIPEGRYRARSVSQDLGLTSGGNEQIAIRLQLHDTPAGYTPPVYVTYFGTFTDRSYEITLKAMRACGWDNDDVTNFSGMGDRDVLVVIAHEEWNGEVSAKVKWINPIGGPGITLKSSMNDAQRIAFAQRMKGRVMAMQQNRQTSALPPPGGNRQAPASSPKPALAATGTDGAPPVDDDDIPF